jgi:hypothetical protein
MIALRGNEEVARSSELWSHISWPSEVAEHAYFLAEAGGEPLALFDDRRALVGRIAERRLEARIGYLPVAAPRLRVLRVVGAVGDAAPLARAALSEVDVVTIPALPVDSREYHSLAPLDGEPFTRPWERRLLVLPDSFDAFLSSRTRKIRSGVRYDAKKLEESLDAQVEIVHDWSPELVEQLDAIAGTTYQRRLGAGFSRERADVLRVAFEHGWARAYLLYDGATPVAFWWCAVHRDTIRLNTTGYLPQYARHRPGIYLLMRVIEDAIADPGLRVLDFGPGRSEYKRHFSSESYLERNLVLYAPGFRARRARLARNGAAAVTLGARRVLDATGGTQRVKTAWRRRLRA